MLQTVAVNHELEMRCHIGRRYQLAHIITAYKNVIGLIKAVTNQVGLILLLIFFIPEHFFNMRNQRKCPYT